MLEKTQDADTWSFMKASFWGSHTHLRGCILGWLPSTLSWGISSKSSSGRSWSGSHIAADLQVMGRRLGRVEELDHKLYTYHRRTRDEDEPSVWASVWTARQTGTGCSLLCVFRAEWGGHDNLCSYRVDHKEINCSNITQTCPYTHAHIYTYAHICRHTCTHSVHCTIHHTHNYIFTHTY